MTRDAHARTERAIAAHFAARGTPAREQEMRLHLRTCADCLDCYRRHLLIAEVDPAAAPAQERLARALGLPSRRARGTTPAWFAWGTIGGAVAAAAAILLVVHAPRRDDAVGSKVASGEFAARGLPFSPAPEIAVYRVPARSKDARPEPAAGVVSSRDELAFAYRNSGGKRWLLIFAVDEHGHVYWYHPGWSDVGDDPAAVPISEAPGLHELPTAVAHQFDSTRMVLHALFTEHSMTVREVEAALRASGGAAAARGDGDPSGAGEALLAIPDAVDVRRPFRIVP